jgi:hypothetical protein
VAAGIVAIAAIAAGAMQQTSTSTQSVAARVGSVTITAASVEREVAAISAEPQYRAALAQASTLALAAPVDPKAVASANGDPDDLRITLAPTGSGTTRAYTATDLRASVLTRQLYVTVMEGLLRSRHVTVTSEDLTLGRQEARVEAGQDRSGASLYDSLPAWYRDELARRGADVDALERSLVGDGGITQAAIGAAYLKMLPEAFTTVCLKATVVQSGGTSAAAAALASGTGGRDAGCAPVVDWATDVAADIRSVAAGTVAPPLQRNGRVAVLLVTRRSQLPLTAVAGNVRATLSTRYTDVVNSLIEDELALSKVTVSPQYGTYENLGTVHGVVPPDALTPPTGGSPGSQVSPPQRFDPFD